MLDTRDLRLIEAVSEEGTLTRAGRRLHTTQPALSRHLRNLEGRLRLTLFHRTGGRMVPTPAGERLQQHARQIMEALRLAEEEAQTLSRGGTERVRIATECYTAYHWLPAVTEEFRQIYRTCVVDLVVGATDDPLAALRLGRIDLALVTGRPGDRAFRHWDAFRDECVLAVHPSHPLASAGRAEAENVAGEHLLLTGRLAESLVYGEFLQPAGVMPARVSTVPVAEGMLAMAEAGLGIAVTPRWAAGPRFRAGTLVAVSLGEMGIHRQWSTVIRRGDPATRRLELFARFLASVAPEPASTVGTPPAEIRG